MNRDSINEILEPRGLLNLPAVEVGVAEGRYSECILGWGIPYLYLVDLWQNSPGGLAELSWANEKHEENLAEVIERLAPHEGKYHILRGWTHLMCDRIEDNTLGFVYLDASHNYENVKRDLECYWPKLVEGGIMAGHDWPLEGVTRAVTEFAVLRNLQIHLLPVNENDASFWLETL